MVIIDASDLILGRLATFVAKRALLGESIDVINCEKAIITGNKKAVLRRYQQKRETGSPKKGPFFPKRPDMLVRRTIRGMISYKKGKGKEAFKRVRCHIGIPKELENQKAETIKEASISRLTTLKYIRVQDLSNSLGARV